MTLRHVLIVLAGLTALVLATGLPASADSGTRPSGPGGVVPPVIGGGGPHPFAALDGPDRSANLSYHGGPVLHTTNTYAIYWRPSGYSLPTGYTTTINQYFTDVAADSGTNGNVYSASTQYSDSTGPIAYNATFGGSAVATDLFPASSVSTTTGGNSTSCGTYPGQDTFQLDALQNCLTDRQLQAEIKAVVAANAAWTPTSSTMYFIYTPEHVGSCYPDGSVERCAYQYYCAYHSSFSSNGKTYVYAVIPYPNEPAHQGADAIATSCAADGQQYPNAGDASWDARAADQAINVTSHEHNEAITDPLLNAWWVGSQQYFGYENGDLCAWAFDTAPTTGNSGTDNGWDQTINGHHYFIQGEWSNKAATTVPESGCVWDNVGPTNSSAPQVGGTSAVGNTLTGTFGTWTGGPTAYTYTWSRCDPEGNACTAIVKQTVTADVTQATYTLGKADDKHTILFSVAATNGKGSAAADALLTGVIGGEPEGATPTISGTATVGQQLTGDVDAAGWSYPATSYKALWERCDNNGSACRVIKTIALPAATTTSVYTLTAADDLHTVVFGVVASNAVGTSFESDSDPTSIVNGEPESGTPHADAPGSPLVGAPSVLDLGTWSFPPTTYSVTWKHCSPTCVAIKTVTVLATRTSTPYTPTSADDKQSLQAVVTAKNAAGSSTPVTVTFGTVVGEPEGATPSISGTPTVGLKLTLDPDAAHWSFAPTSYTVTWQRCPLAPHVNCTTIATSTQSAASPNPTYKLGAGDLNSYVQAKVVAKNAAGSSSPVTTNALGPVGR